MRARNFFGISALLLLGATQTALSASEIKLKLPVPEIEKLPNGLEIAWFSDDAIPVIDLMLVVKAGHRDDPSGKSGTSELLGAVLERGAAGKSAQELAESVDELGASRSISVQEDWLMAGIHGLAPDANKLEEWLADVVLHPDFPAAEITRERDRILDRWRHLSDFSDLAAALAFQRVVASGTSYSRGIFNTLDEFKSIKKSDLVNFYKARFTPTNTLLVIVGRINRPEMKKKIQETFGTWKTGDETKQFKRAAYKTSARILPEKGAILVVNRPGLTQVQVKIGFPAPLFKVKERYALAVTNSLFGEYFNSRLNSVIRDKLGLTYSIGSGFAYNEDFADFGISSSTRNEAAGKLIKKTLEMLRELKTSGISAEEVSAAKDYLIGGFPLSVSTLAGVASRWLGGYMFDMGADYLNEFIPKVAQVTRADADAAVKKYFNVDNPTIVIVCDYKAAKKSMDESGFKKVKVIKIEDLVSSSAQFTN